MPRDLVIGADGFIGGRLRTLLGPEAEGTSRRNPTLHGFHMLDLLDFDVAKLPLAETVYICAGVNGAMACEGKAESYRVNVDATIRLAQYYAVPAGAVVVWISSTTVEWSNSAYARQKALTEIALRMLPRTAIVRAGRVLHSNVDDLCKTLVAVARNGPRFTLWGTDEQPYAK